MPLRLKEIPEVQPTRPLFRILAGVVSVVYALLAVAFIIWDQGDMENLVIIFFAVLMFLHMAAGGTFSKRAAKRRMRLHLLARLYVANRITLEEFGERASQAMGHHVPRE